MFSSQAAEGPGAAFLPRPDESTVVIALLEAANPAESGRRVVVLPGDAQTG